MVHEATARAQLEVTSGDVSSAGAGLAGSVDRTLAALAEPVRRRIVDLLRERPYRASELADAVELSRPAMSRHLRVLRGAGVIEQDVSDVDARVRIVQLRQAPFAELRDWVEEVERFWCDQLESFRHYVVKRTAPADESPARRSKAPRSTPEERVNRTRTKLRTGRRKGTRRR